MDQMKAPVLSRTDHRGWLPGHEIITCTMAHPVYGLVNNVAHHGEGLVRGEAKREMRPLWKSDKAVT